MGEPLAASTTSGRRPIRPKPDASRPTRWGTERAGDSVRGTRPRVRARRGVRGGSAPRDAAAGAPPGADDHARRQRSHRKGGAECRAQCHTVTGPRRRQNPGADFLVLKDAWHAQHGAAPPASRATRGRALEGHIGAELDETALQNRQRQSPLGAVGHVDQRNGTRIERIVGVNICLNMDS